MDKGYPYYMSLYIMLLMLPTLSLDTHHHILYKELPAIYMG